MLDHLHQRAGPGRHHAIYTVANSGNMFSVSADVYNVA